MADAPWAAVCRLIALASRSHSSAGGEASAPATRRWLLKLDAAESSESPSAAALTHAIVCTDKPLSGDREQKAPTAAGTRVAHAGPLAAPAATKAGTLAPPSCMAPSRAAGGDQQPDSSHEEEKISTAPTQEEPGAGEDAT